MPDAGKVAHVSVWEDDDSLEAFLADPIGEEVFEGGWRVRLEPLRSSGNRPIALDHTLRTMLAVKFAASIALTEGERDGRDPLSA